MEDELIDFDVAFDYSPQDFILTIDMDRYFDEFPKMKYVQIKMMEKKYRVDRKALAQMMESLEAL